MTEPSPSTEEFLQMLEEENAPEMAEYLRMVRSDKERADETGDDEHTFVTSGRTFTANGEEISHYIDIGIVFGSLWEKEDPSP